jgi:hypothetical protein
MPSLAVVANVEEAADRPRGVEILQGDLFEVGLAALLQLAQYEALSGWLEVARRGAITLYKGQAVDSRCAALRGLDALRELLFHRGGRFSLRRGATEPPGGPALSVTFALMDAYRLRDEFARVSDCAFRAPPARPWPDVGAPVDRVVARCDGRRTLAQACQAADEPFTLVIDPLLHAIGDGRLERADLVHAARDDLPAGADFFELVDRGRDLMRQGEHRSAHAVLLRALALRPDDRVVQQNLRALAQRLQQP